ncbi:MaoC family dehydratase N-terminal domain-containing protein [uncultured Friedmanniella sp.]|uniref:FAS1-like dehydratase domain-containing protein n=1 Tax=uncultured Friedmanniella sp. TaxID=335381 RepID=UPI0035CB89EC
MGITEAHTGRRYPPTAPYEVPTAKIAEFAAALGDDHPRYAGDDAVAPPTFVAVIAATAWQAMFEDPELGLALPRIVHGDQRFTITRLLRAGDRVTAGLVIDRVRSRGPADIITASVEVRSLSDELVATATATFFHSREVAA